MNAYVARTTNPNHGDRYRSAYTPKEPANGWTTAISASAYVMMNAITAPIRYVTMTPGPASRIVTVLPRKRPTPIALPIAIIVSWRDVSCRCSPSSVEVAGTARVLLLKACRLGWRRPGGAELDDEDSSRQLVGIDARDPRDLATRSGHRGHLDVDLALGRQAEVHRHHALRAIAPSGIYQTAAEDFAGAWRVDAHFRSRARVAAVLVDNVHLNRSPRAIGRQHVAEQIMPAGRVVIRQRQIERTVAVEVGPLHAVCRAVPGDDLCHRIGEPGAVVVIKEIVLVDCPLDVRRHV